MKEICSQQVAIKSYFIDWAFIATTIRQIHSVVLDGLIRQYHRLLALTSNQGDTERRASADRWARLPVCFGVDVHHCAARGVHHIL